MNTLPEKSVDLIYADPPYNLQLENDLYRPNKTKVDAVQDTWDKFDSFEQYDSFTRAWLSACRRVLKDNGTLWVSGSYHNIFRVGTILMDLGYWILNDVHWYKTNPMPNFRGTRFTNATETMIWAKKSAEQKSYTFNYHAMKRMNDDLQMQNVWELPICTGLERLKIDGKKAHPTQKPEALLFRVVSAASNPNDVVLDPFSGTGTTAVVSKLLRRNFIGIEQDAHYVALSQARLAATQQTSEAVLYNAPTRRSRARIKFGSLIELGLLAIGSKLYSKDAQTMGRVLADGSIELEDGFVGSIHSTAAHIQAGSSGNGWEFWYFKDQNSEFKLIDVLRETARGLANVSTD